LMIFAVKIILLLKLKHQGTTSCELLFWRLNFQNTCVILNLWITFIIWHTHRLIDLQDVAVIDGCSNISKYHNQKDCQLIYSPLHFWPVLQIKTDCIWFWCKGVCFFGYLSIFSNTFYNSRPPSQIFIPLWKYPLSKTLRKEIFNNWKQTLSVINTYI
jgi:hypothetical protein